MKKCIALSTAILAATFTFAPLASGQQQNAQQQAQAAQQRAQQEAQNAQNQARQAGAQVAGRTEEAGQMSPDQHFVWDAASDNQFEIQEAQQIQQKAQNEQVKQLCQQIIQDHQQAQQQLQKVAQEANLRMPSQIEEWQQAKLQHMEKHQGEMAERGFVFGQVGAHMADILKYRYEAEHAQNPQLKQYAQQALQTLEHHEQMARQTAEQWVPEARTAGEHIRGTGTNTNTNNTNNGTGQTGNTGTGTGTGAGTGNVGGGANHGINR